ncbi:MAG TPA: YbhB/YbcL family Raf kinase inhibitor-like protein [archaeon]|nr:YbhB/YbcL family Raf kinase inhibitor-like protein [archaeon]
MSMQLTSPAFKNADMIPDRYTCKGQDTSPALKWSGSPKETKSFALIFDDPDAPMGTWVHWVVYNLPSNCDSLPEKVPDKNPLGNGGIQGTNSWGRIGYGGPCPPSGTHRYFFRLYALDSVLDLKAGATKSQVLKALEGHILAEVELMGRYSRH